MSHMSPEPEYPQPVRPTAGDDGGAYVPQPAEDVEGTEGVEDLEGQDGADETDEPTPA